MSWDESKEGVDVVPGAVLSSELNVGNVVLLGVMLNESADVMCVGRGVVWGELRDGNSVLMVGSVAMVSD